MTSPTHSRIMDALEEAQERNGGCLSEPVLRALARELDVPVYHLYGVATFFPHFRLTAPAPRQVRVCTDLSCRLRGGAALHDELAAVARARPAGEITVEPVSCLGRCDGAPALSIDDAPYWRLDAETRRELMAALRRGAPLPPAPPALPLAGLRVDPYTDGTPRWSALRRAVADDPATVLAAVKGAQLRGMGGAGFPAAVKWEAVRNAPGDEKFIVCNADESEPGTIKDRGILTSAPHLLVEGMAVAGVVTGAERGVVYIRHEYGPERECLARAIAEARAAGALGERVLGSSHRFELDIFVSPGGYICGEETALLEALEGRRAQPRLKPPLPVHAGLFGKPTVINNVETLAAVPVIVLRGADWWAGEGAGGAPGLKFIGLSGHVARPGVYEVPFGTTFRDAIERFGGGVLDGRALKAVVPSGASSGVLPARLADTPMEWGALAKVRSMVGSSAVVVVADGTCMLDLALNVARFFARESCGKCWPCRVGSDTIVRLLEAATQGTAGPDGFESVADLTLTLEKTSICGLGQVVPAPVRSVLEHFPEEVAAHLRERRCPAGTCGMRPIERPGGAA